MTQDPTPLGIGVFKIVNTWNYLIERKSHSYNGYINPCKLNYLLLKCCCVN
jgi:hypothetical protein